LEKACSLVQYSHGRPTLNSRSLDVSKCLPPKILAVLPLTGRLVVRSGDGYSSHRPFSRGQTGLHFNIFSNGVFSILPSSYFPTEALERRLGFTRLPSHGIDLLPPPVPSPTFEHFLSTQPEWSRRLLPTLVTWLSKSNTFLATTTTANCVPDEVTANSSRTSSKSIDSLLSQRHIIDRENHPQAIRYFQATSTIFLVKILSIWLPVGRQFIITMQQYIRANILHVLVKMKTLITHFDAQTLNVASEELSAGIAPTLKLAQSRPCLSGPSN
jgi:hypothetical protein